MLDELTADRFRASLNDPFTLHTPGREPFEAELIEVRGLSSHSQRHDRSPFSLLFRAPANCYVPQQIVHLQNAKMGPLDLFLVPVGPDPKDAERRMLYEAIFT